MGLSREELLRPSLKDVAVASAPYSVQTVFLTSFLGGPFAAIAILGVNSWRLQRLKQDLLPLALMFVAAAGLLGVLHLVDWGVELRNYLTSLGGRSTVSY